MKKKVILLVGPSISLNDKAYGGGVGGYVRNMKTYIDVFNNESIDLIPSFHTVRSGKGKILYRTLKDMFGIILSLIKYRPYGTHILAQYRGALFREFYYSVVFSIFRVPYIYDIKAGSFISWYKKTSVIKKKMATFILKRARFVFCEGEVYLDFLKNEFDLDGVYWPNFLDEKDINKEFSFQARRHGESLIISFVGYCYPGKGIYELIHACNQLAGEGYKITLNIMGKESDEYVAWLNDLEIDKNIYLNRLGIIGNEVVLKNLSSSHVFCLPTKHSGEGHNNSINEAMLNGSAIICNNHGFLKDILSPDCGIIVNSYDDLLSAIRNFYENEPMRLKFSINARNKFLKNFHSGVLLPKLYDYYTRLIANK